MRLATVAFFLGVLLSQNLPTLPTFSVVWFIIPLLILSFYTPRLRFICWFTLGVCWVVFRAQLFFAQALPLVLEGQEVLAEGYIIDLPNRKGNGWQFDFAPTRLITKDKQVISNVGHIRLSWYKSSAELRTGQQWLFTIKLQRARGFSNPFTSDYSQTLYQQGIQATGSIRPKGKQQLLKEASRWQINVLREYFAKQIQVMTEHHPFSGILIALSVGEQQWISPEQWNVFRQTGIAHLVAISGLHIGLLAGLSFWLSRQCLGFMIYWYGFVCHRYGFVCSGKILHLPTMLPAAMVSLFVAFSYSLLAGFSIPTQRSLVMISVFAIALLGLRQLSTGSAFSLALLAVLIYDPTAVLSNGFWLSFGAVACILLAIQGRHVPTHKILRIIHQYGYVQLAVTLGLIPVTLYFFGYFSLSSLLANTIAIPIFSFFLVPLNLFAMLLSDIFPTLSYLLFQLCLYVLGHVWLLMEYLASLSWSSVHTSVPPFWTVLTALIGVMILLLPKGFSARWIGGIWLLPLFFMPIQRPMQGETWITILDVGQGLAVFIQTATHTVLYDTGMQSYTGFNTGKIVVVPFLIAQDIKNLDTLIVSHGDSDHSGGLNEVLKQITVKQLISTDKIVKKYPQAQRCQAGQQWIYDDVHFQILHPAQGFYSQENNMSCVLKISTPQQSILLTSDIEKLAENNLLRTNAEALKADILLAPHHGSKTSSTPSFVEKVNPQYVVFSTGYRNTYKFPHTEVLIRYQTHGVMMLNTATDGAIQFRLNQTGELLPLKNKEEQKRYWHY
ncbi:DNA internalization-related competence protein ComEC/Rec2 [Beggiatoa alba B18LD]|uniref:DNA internalization-related competence protein ComEC/Rec2 n=1 Tax=Beggiatoa alba B18LD TaxID=395493 RepID=I3CIX7_9GAMM|nr:DNA internalization-related competence protein ComEC/Rec2 [Beggiatoa alba]EIJ43570.1 DNA internalization-related competence protein ComEC/Rec2 [Beggiatoa alba B18LD]